MLVLLSGKLPKIDIEIQFNIAVLVDTKQFLSNFWVDVDIDEVAAQLEQPDFVFLDLPEGHVRNLVLDVVVHILVVDVEVPNIAVDSCTQDPDQIWVPKLRVGSQFRP